MSMKRKRTKARPDWTIRPGETFSPIEKQVITEQAALRARLSIDAPQREKLKQESEQA